MANLENLQILAQGVTAWNQWRNRNRQLVPDLRRADLINFSLAEINLSGANLTEAQLIGADLHGANLSQANLNGVHANRANLQNADLSGASLIDADLRQAELNEADLTGASLNNANVVGADLEKANLSKAVLFEADLSNANLSRADLRDANLSAAWLRQANLTETNLIGANLTNANLTETNLSSAMLKNADLSRATLMYTFLGSLDLRGVKGLESVEHRGPSSIGIDTLFQSNGVIPDVFLSGAGVPEDFIPYTKSLVGTALDFYSCFISYSDVDHEFAEHLYAALREFGVRCWYAPEDLKIGAKIRIGIDEAIHIHDKLLVVLSANSIKSSWVESEVEAAFEKERKQNRLVLFPVRIDDAVMTTNAAWAKEIRRTRNIGDLTNWKHFGSFQKAVERILRDLKADKVPSH